MHPISSAAETLDAEAARLWKAYDSLENDPVRAIDILSAISHNYKMAGLQEASDSVTNLLFQSARMNGDRALLMSTMNDWFSSLVLFDGIPPFKDTQRVAGYVRTMMNTARQAGDDIWHSQAWHAQALLEFSKRNIERAGLAANKSYYYASLSSNRRQQFAALLIVGSCEKNMNHKLDAFRHYMDALSLAREVNDPELLIRVYEKLFLFFNSVNNHEKAEEYLYKIFPLIEARNEADSERVIYHYINLSLLQYAQHEYDAGLSSARKVIGYCQRVNNNYYRDDLLTVLRSILLEQGEYERLSDLYRKSYPNEWQRIAKKDPVVYNQLRAAFAEADGQYDSSQYYYGLAAEMLRAKDRSPGLKAFFYRRYGQALLRFGRTAQALLLIDTALRYSERIKYLPYMAELSNTLDSIYASSDKMEAAYGFAKLNQRYATALNQANRQDEILMLDLENELRGRELQAERERAETQRRHNIQYSAILLLIGFSFLILLLLGSFRVPRWVITAMGFFSFIFFFEFIILLIDHRLHELTHGEPWKILSIKIVIIGILAPLHHWLEHRVVHYLQTHSLIRPGPFTLRGLMQRMLLFKLPKSPSGESAASKEPQIKH